MQALAVNMQALAGMKKPASGGLEVEQRGE
jgi:hypothetical protein